MEIVTVNDIRCPETLLSVHELYRTYQADSYFPHTQLKKRFLKDGRFVNFYNDICIEKERREDYLVMVDSRVAYGLAYIRHSAFETNIFEKRMGMLHLKLRDDARATAEDLRAFLEASTDAAKDDGYEHISIRVPAYAAPLIVSLQRSGFIYIAGLVTFVFSRGETSLKRLKNLYQVRAATSSDMNRALEISENAFSGTRFTNDPSLDNDKCSHLYREWIRRCFDSGWASNIFAAVNAEDDVVGFLTYLIDAELKEKADIIRAGRGLAACLPSAKGAYISLLQSSLDADFRKKGGDFIEYTIPLENLEVIRIYNRLGFRLGKIEHIFRREF